MDIIKSLHDEVAKSLDTVSKSALTVINSYKLLAEKMIELKIAEKERESALIKFRKIGKLFDKYAKKLKKEKHAYEKIKIINNYYNSLEDVNDTELQYQNQLLAVANRKRIVVHQKLVKIHKKYRDAELNFESIDRYYHSAAKAVIALTAQHDTDNYNFDASVIQLRESKNNLQMVMVKLVDL
jgi:hypothetical protein